MNSVESVDSIEFLGSSIWARNGFGYLLDFIGGSRRN